MLTRLKKIFKSRMQVWLKSLVLILVIGAIALSWSDGAQAEGRKSQLADRNAITDPVAILRYALPIDNPEVRRIQASLEDISYHLRVKRWPLIAQDIKNAAFVVNYYPEKILASVPGDRQAQATEILEQIKGQLNKLQEVTEAKDKEKVIEGRDDLLNQVTTLEELMVTGFPFEIPSAYAHLPQLKGRATVEITTNKGSLTIIADGYSAPINAGNFIDLVSRGFYDGLEFFQGQDFIVQAGDPPGDEVGFIDPTTKQYRSIPLEVLVQGEKQPRYGVTLEDAGLYLAKPALPFNSYGAVALARPSDDPNGGSSQFFFFLFDNELTPPGFNLMDGRYSVFGYLVEGRSVLESLQEGDKIISAKVVSGLENLVSS